MKNTSCFLFLLLFYCLFFIAFVTPAAAQAPTARLSNTDPEAQGEPFYLVPELGGELTLELGGSVRRAGEVQGGSALPELGGVGRLGYRRYLDAIGQLALGGYLAGQVDASSAPRRGSLDALSLGVSLEGRLMNPSLFFILFGLWAEGGLVTYAPLDDASPATPLPPEALQQDALGWRVAAGVESGLGVLGWLDPYIYGEVPIWLGVEHVELDSGASWTATILGARLRFGWAHR